VIDINTPAGAPPRDLLDKTLRELVGRIVIRASMPGEAVKPPQLQPSITRARIAQELDDVEGVVSELFNIADAAIAGIVRVRAAAEEDPTL
jgi:hypothetical protein